LLPFAVLNPGRGLERLYDKRFVTNALSENAPEVINIQYPEVMVTSAHYEEEASVLTLRIKPGTAYRGLVDIGIGNLNNTQSYSVLLDGEVAYKLSQGAVTKVTPGPGLADLEYGKRNSDGIVAHCLRAPHRVGVGVFRQSLGRSRFGRGDSLGCFRPYAKRYGQRSESFF
jgi:hypothetical protein